MTPVTLAYATIAFLAFLGGYLLRLFILDELRDRKRKRQEP